MNTTLIISNRLPVQLNKQKETIRYKPSIGGLATGLHSVHHQKDSLWLGWCGIENEQLNASDKKNIRKTLQNKYQCAPVFLSQREVELFYNAFSNKTLWPLFHHFPMLTEYDHTFWQGYQDVNQKYFEALKPFIRGNERVWVHDYQLLLLPKLIRDAYPDMQIGFFLHIPFPSFEIFRLLPWREEILNGMLGADLIGFHTYNYTRHFLSSVRRILRLDANLLTIQLENRQSHVDVFPMGIDYRKFTGMLNKASVKNQIRKFRTTLGDMRVILSVDRLDYTKGIPNRLRAFDKFLERHPAYKGKIALVMIVAPSRTDVDTYMTLKTELDVLVTQINSRHGTIGYTPITYFFRSFSANALAALYGLSDILLVTPLRDGMNLVVKEYIACRKDDTGAVIISETTGASHELGEALVINANNVDEIADSIYKALNMSVEEQKKINRLHKERLKQNSVDHWASDFLQKLEEVTSHQETIQTNIFTKQKQHKAIAQYQEAKKRLLFLDYDGTLVSFKDKPEHARPDKELLGILDRLCRNKKNELVIISGRHKKELTEWLGHLPCHLTAGHGIWVREKDKKWERIETMDNGWKEVIRPVLTHFVHRTPGSFIEEKTYSLAWHYRKCDPDFANTRLSELKATLMVLTNNLNIGILEGSKVIEIKDTSVHKGRAAGLWLSKIASDFILAIGDDWTDEDTFAALPDTAWSVKVGFNQTRAKYTLRNVKEVRAFLKLISAASK